MLVCIAGKLAQIDDLLFHFMSSIFSGACDHTCTIAHYAWYYSRTSIIRTSIIRTLDYPNSSCNEKCRVKVQIVVTCLDCACAVNLHRIVATRAQAAAWLPSLVLSLKEVKETQGKCSVNRG